MFELCTMPKVFDKDTIVILSPTKAARKVWSVSTIAVVAKGRSQPIPKVQVMSWLQDNGLVTGFSQTELAYLLEFVS